MKNVTKLFILWSLSVLGGCASGTHVIAMTPTGEIGKDFKNVAKGKVHLYPVTQGNANVKTKDGRTNLEQTWTPASRAESSYTTTADLPAIIAERSKQALQEAGYTVTYGPEAPADAMLSLRENILAVYENPSTPVLANMATVFFFGFVGTSSHPVGDIYVKATYEDAKGDKESTVIRGYGKSSAHLTVQSGYDRSMAFALTDFQQNLTKATRKQLQ
ncbi:hypothetical protein [Geomonas subterranea]|uniref:hypothetical protein n=1 Tax=Geomonas subterranea TaxID=2847989 RepID=UPI001CD1C23A|nr:hypothetical protein [Geomonas fuzhouensis]